MPLMPIPPIPTKWMGPISRGSLMKVSSLTSRLMKDRHGRDKPGDRDPNAKSAVFRLNSGDFHDQIGQPLGGIEPAGGLGGARHRRKLRGLGGKRRDFRGEAIGRE